MSVSSVVSGDDYTNTNGQVVFAIGECTQDIIIPIRSDGIREEDEYFTVELATDCCAEVTIGQVQVTITEALPDCKYIQL